jgi:hypothetical protein
LEVEVPSPTGPVVADPTVSGAGIFHGVAAETGTPLEEVLGDTTDRVPVAAAVVAPPAWDPAEAEGSVVVEVAAAAVGGGDSRESLESEILRSTKWDRHLRVRSSPRFDVPS